MPPFTEILQRADEYLLQEMLGRPALRLLQAILGKDLPVARLRGVLQDLRTPAALLADASARSGLVDLLRPEEATQVADELREGSGLDGYARLKNVPFARTSPRFRALLSALNVEEDFHESPGVPPSSERVDGAYGLFDHQRLAASRATNLLQAGPRRVLLHMPTGSGKTRTAMSVISRSLREHEPQLVIWLATSEELCAQAAAEFERCWASMGDRPVTLHRFWGRHELDLSALSDGVIVAGLKKLHATGTRNLPFLASLGDRVDLIVIDEAHQAVAQSYRGVMDSLIARNPRASLLGLTATPGRTWNRPSEDRELAEYFAERKVTLEVTGYSSPVKYLIDAGYLAKPTFRALRHPRADLLTERELRALADELDLPDFVLSRLADDEIRNVAIVREVQQLITRHRRILVFAATVGHALLLATVLRALGVAAQAVSGATPSPERSRLISWYKDAADEPRVLANYGVLTTGFDAPSTSAAVIARPTKSLVLFSQMVGRTTRGIKAGGNLEAEVVTVVDTALPGFGDLTTAFTNWEDVW